MTRQLCSARVKVKIGKKIYEADIVEFEQSFNYIEFKKPKHENLYKLNVSLSNLKDKDVRKIWKMFNAQKVHTFRMAYIECGPVTEIIFDNALFTNVRLDTYHGSTLSITIEGEKLPIILPKIDWKF